MANEFKITPALLVVLYLAVLPLAVQQPAQEQSFSQSHDSPASIGLVIDISKSMTDKKDKVVEAMVDLVKASNPQDQFFVIHFNDDVYLDQDFTQNAGLVIEAVRRSDARGGTALNDAMLASADHLRKAAKYKRKILVLVGDGSDNESHAIHHQPA